MKPHKTGLCSQPAHLGQTCWPWIFLCGYIWKEEELSSLSRRGRGMLKGQGDCTETCGQVFFFTEQVLHLSPLLRQPPGPLDKEATPSKALPSLPVRGAAPAIAGAWSQHKAPHRWGQEGKTWGLASAASRGAWLGIAPCLKATWGDPRPGGTQIISTTPLPEHAFYLWNGGVREAERTIYSQ